MQMQRKELLKIEIRICKGIIKTGDQEHKY